MCAGLYNRYPPDLTINQTLAGVAQLVERVALITAKRSTSRSWVRAPPSAIPVISSSEQLFFLSFCCQSFENGLQEEEAFRGLPEGYRGVRNVYDLFVNGARRHTILLLTACVSDVIVP